MFYYTNYKVHVFVYFFLNLILNLLNIVEFTLNEIILIFRLKNIKIFYLDFIDSSHLARSLSFAEDRFTTLYLRRTCKIKKYMKLPLPQCSLNLSQFCKNNFTKSETVCCLQYFFRAAKQVLFNIKKCFYPKFGSSKTKIFLNYEIRMTIILLKVGLQNFKLEKICECIIAATLL